MNDVYFGIFIGIFLTLASQRFLVVAGRAWKQRKEDEAKRAKDEAKRADEHLQELVYRAMGKPKLKGE